MRLLIVTVSLWALATAKPETYKEKEDFQYSRSSSDDGSRAGYYGAQRGNMGGNYEKAHNMDSLAQHQMSTLVRQVDGELGDGGNTRTGSVFTSGNSRGIYGSGNYDLSNLKGRNFHDGAYYDNLYTSSLLSQNSKNHANLYSGGNNARYSTSQLQASGFNSGSQHGDFVNQHAQTDAQQAENQYLQSSNNNDFGGADASKYRYYSQRGSQERSEYKQSGDSFNTNTKSRLVSVVPTKIYMRPGTRVTIPVAAQTFDSSQYSLLQNQRNINSDAVNTDLLNTDKFTVIKHASVPKHYESSYNYHKEWEKHDAQPIPIIPTENPYPKNSELYEDTQIFKANGQNYQNELDSTNILSRNTKNSHSNIAHSSTLNSASSNAYNANKKSLNSNQLAYLSETQKATALGSSSDAFQIDNLGASDVNNNLNLLDANSRPKSYQSSYSYHKSWERHGDPYVIQPSGNGITELSQNLINDASGNSAQSYDQYGKRYSGSHDDCVEGHRREKRSYRSFQNNGPELQQNQNPSYQTANKQLQDFGQQTQHTWDSLTNLDKQAQNQLGKLEDLGQQTQTSWGDLESFGQQQSQLGKFEDLGQQTQNTWESVTNLDQQAQNQLGKLEDLGQQTQNSWGDLESFGQQQSQLGKFEDLGQQTQNTWDSVTNLDQQAQNQLGKLEDLGQETQNTWGDLESFGQQQSQLGKFEDLGQQTQNTWDSVTNLDQQAQNQLGKLEDLGQETQNSWGDLESFGQQQSQLGKFEDLGQQTQNTRDSVTNFDQQAQNQLGKLEDLGQQTQNTWGDLESFGQQQDRLGKFEDLGQQTQNTSDSVTNFDQQAQNQLGKLEDLGQQTQNSWGDLESFGQQQSQLGKFEDSGQQTQNTRDSVTNFDQQAQNQLRKLEDLGQQTQNSWGELESFGQHQSQLGKFEDLNQQAQNIWNNLPNIGQQLPHQLRESIGQEKQIDTDHIDKLSQENNNQDTWENIVKLSPQPPSNKLNVLLPQEENKMNNFQDINQQSIQIVDKNLQSEVKIKGSFIAQDEDKEAENKTQNTPEQTNFNFWNNINLENVNSLQDTEHNFDPEQKEPHYINQYNWHQQTSRNQIFHNQQHFNTWDHSTQSMTHNYDKSISNEFGNGKETLLWDQVDKLIEQSENKEDEKTHTSNNFLYIKTETSTDKEISLTNKKFENNNENVGRGDIGSEDIQDLSGDKDEKNKEKVIREPKFYTINHKNKMVMENSETLSVDGLENQKVFSTSTPALEHTPIDLNTQYFPGQFVSEVGLNHFDAARIFNNIEQQNLEQHLDNLLQQSKTWQGESLLDFNHQAYMPISQNIQPFSQSNSHLQETQRHVTNNKDVNEKLQNSETTFKINTPDMEPNPVEVSTEKPGFWKSVWGKTLNTKDKVVSWFKY